MFKRRFLRLEFLSPLRSGAPAQLNIINFGKIDGA